MVSSAGNAAADAAAATPDADAPVPLAGGYLPADASELVGQRSRMGGADVPLAFPAIWGSYRDWLLIEVGVAASTISTYRRAAYDFNWYLSRLPRPKPWHKATDADARRWLGRPVAAGVRRGQPLSAAYRNSCLTAVKGLYRFAYRSGVLRRDPMALVGHPKVRPGTPRAIEVDQLRTVLLAASGDDRLALLVALGYFGCLRCVEMARLHVEDFVPTPRPGRLRVLGKGSVERWVPVHLQLRAVLDRYLARRQLRPGAALLENRRFPGSPLTAGAVSRLLADHMHAVGTAATAHALRHTGATAALAAAEGTNLEEVRELLGHRETATTRRYTSAYQWDVRSKAVDVIPDPTDPKVRRP